MQSGFFSCNSDVRIDYPFENQNYTALWATHDYDQWDLFLTVVMGLQTTESVVATSGADLSDRKGCYEIGESEQVVACEFYMPNRDDKFGILFTGDNHVLQHELEWDYNPSWNSFFGGW